MATQEWKIDTSHSGIHFTVRHMVVSKVRGVFGEWEGSLKVDDANPEASVVSVKIQTGSIDTREPRRDAHLRSADFFDAENFPLLTFESKKVEGLAGEEFRLVGDLTIRGITREVVLETERLGRGKDPWGNERISFQARTVINRKDFGLNWNQALEAGGVLVGEKVEIALDVQAVKAQASADQAA